MTGIEPIAVAGGGRLLGSLAAPAAKALARKMTFRWRVCSRVRKRVDFKCPWRSYRKWLKSITPEELDSPVEDVHAPLAKRLDEALSAASADWCSADDHLSRALRLVALTYPAIAAALDSADRTEVAEKWAQQRSAQVLDRLLDLAGPDATLSSKDLAAVLWQRSAARRAIRLQAFGLDEASLSPFFEKSARVKVSAGAVVVLLGDFGSGKSEAAETWHRSSIKDLNEIETAPFPVWLSARELHGEVLELVVSRRLPRTWRNGRGASITIDGVDETDPSAAERVLDAARLVTSTYTNVTVLLTARPGALAVSPAEQMTMNLLTDEDALTLVELAGGKSEHTWAWTADMRATVTRPFFALAVGSLLAHSKFAKGQAELIRVLVESNLSRGTERSAVTSADTRLALQKLALNLTRSDRDGLSFSERQTARTSRLVADGANDSVLFSLPIFQHWFAAQSILDGGVPAAEVVAGARSFNRWRWAAAVAALSAPDEKIVDELLGTWVSSNPGAASWIISEAFRGRRESRSDADGILEPKSSGERLLRALRRWTDALGSLSKGLVPATVAEGPVTLGIAVANQSISVGYSTANSDIDEVIDAPPRLDFFQPNAIADWHPWFSATPPKGDAWPWVLIRDQIARRFQDKLAADPLLGAPQGVWVQERRYDLARRILDDSSLFRRNLPAAEVRSKAVKLLERSDGIPNARFDFGGKARFPRAEVTDLISWIDATASEHIPSHLPEADVSNPHGHFVWDFFSEARLMEFEVEVYGRACEAFDEALAYSFAKLGWSMPGSAFAPFGVVLELRRGGDDRIGNIPLLDVTRVPMALLTEVAATGGCETRWSSSGRAAISHIEGRPADDQQRRLATYNKVHSWAAEQGREAIAELGFVATGADDMTVRRPASSVAAQWIWRDLQRIGLGDGFPPDLY